MQNINELFNKLYSNIGDKLQLLAKICGAVGVVIAAIGILVMLFAGGAGFAVVIMGVGSLISSWPLYAFGQLVNDIHNMKAGASKEKSFDPVDLPEI